MQFQPYPFQRLQALLDPLVPNEDFAPMALTIGEPQFETPHFIKEALCEHVDLFNKYPKTAGESKLREAQRDYLARRFDLHIDDAQLIPTFGTREVLFNFPQFLLHDKPDPVMAFPNPFYQIYEGAAIASRAKIHYMHLHESNGFLPEIDEAMLSECDLVILNSPNNPTASVMDLEELKRWVRLALKYDFVLLNDECYIDLYLKAPIPSILNASIAVGNTTFHNVIAINSLSKRSSAPGLRSGFIAGDAEILKGYLTYRTYVGCASPLPLQHAAAVAWRDDAHVEVFRDNYRRNFEVAASILGTSIPNASFYIWLPVGDEVAFTKRAYSEYNLKLLPGSFLGREGAGKGFVRLALVYEEAQTREALERVAALLETSKEG